MMKQILTVTLALTFFNALLIVQSCSKSSDEVSGDGMATIGVNLASDEVDNRDQLFGSMKSNLPDQNSLLANPSSSLKEEIPFNDDFYIITDLVEEQPDVPRANKRLKDNTKADAVISPIQRQIKFRLAVYNSSGNYVTDKIYSISTTGSVTPDDGQQLQVNRGQYHFVAYSYNTNSAPTETLTGTTINSVLDINPATYPSFIMFNSGLRTIVPGADNSLNIAFKYRFSGVRVLVDATATGYLISEIGATSLASTRSAASVTLLNGNVAFSGETSNRAITFPTATGGAATRQSSFSSVANNITNGTLTIASLNIGPLNRTTPISIPNVRFDPGVVYNLRVRIVPNDSYVTVNGVEAAVINGRQWMRRNLGVAASVNPDEPAAGGSFQTQMGNYYQWGRRGVRATPTTGAVATDTTGLWTTNAANGSWYNATPATNGGKVTANDPCPTGWRVPTSAEWSSLVAATTQLTADNRGADWAASNTKFTSAKVFRSRRNSNVILTFPASGYYQPSDRTLALRGNAGYYWSSTEASTGTSIETTSLRAVLGQAEGAVVGQGSGNRPFAFNIRCTRAVL